MNNDDMVYGELAFNAELITQALTSCQDPGDRAIFERGLIALDRIAARAYGGAIIRFLEDLRDVDLAGRVAVVYNTRAGSSIIHAEKMRERKAVKDANRYAIFDAAVKAEAKKLNKQPAASSKFAAAVEPGLKKQGFSAGREKVLNSVRRIKSACRRRKSTGS